eukprot:603203-Pleurochrysis_carterae.AAC.2
MENLYVLGRMLKRFKTFSFVCVQAIVLDGIGPVCATRFVLLGLPMPSSLVQHVDCSVIAA